MAQLTIDVPENLVDELRRMFPDEADAAAKIAALAFTEYGQWLTGESRPANLSEQSILRVSQIFSEILPPSNS